MGRAAGCQAFVDLILEGVGGEGDDRRLLALLLLLPSTNGCRGFKAVLDRHLHVHEHHIVAARLKTLDADGAVFGHVELVGRVF